MKTISRQNKTSKIIFLTIIGLVVFYLFAVPWRNFVFEKNLSDGKSLLRERKYTEAYVKFEKAAILNPFSKEPDDLLALAKNAAADILSMRDFLRQEQQNDLLSLIDGADSKACNLEADRTLIEKNLAQIALVNLKFCTTDGPKNYDSWLFLGIANQKLSEDSYIFKELKPGYRQAALAAYEAAYKVDPINKSAPTYLVALYKVEGNQQEVDHWQNLLDNLGKIEKL